MHNIKEKRRETKRLELWNFTAENKIGTYTYDTDFLQDVVQVHHNPAILCKKRVLENK